MKITKAQLKKWFRAVSIVEEEYFSAISSIEDRMRKETGIKDLILFHCDGYVAGIGNESRTMKFIHR